MTRFGRLLLAAVAVFLAVFWLLTGPTMASMAGSSTGVVALSGKRTAAVVVAVVVVVGAGVLFWFFRRDR